MPFGGSTGHEHQHRPGHIKTVDPNIALCSQALRPLWPLAAAWPTNINMASGNTGQGSLLVFRGDMSHGYHLVARPQTQTWPLTAWSPLWSQVAAQVTHISMVPGNCMAQEHQHGLRLWPRPQTSSCHQVTTWSSTSTWSPATSGPLTHACPQHASWDMVVTLRRSTVESGLFFILGLCPDDPAAG